MQKSLTWIQLSDKEWLLVCVNYIVPLSLSMQNQLIRQGILIQSEGCIVSASDYEWKSYRVWKKENKNLSNEDKIKVENALKTQNKEPQDDTDTLAETVHNNAYLNNCNCPVCNHRIHRGAEERTFYCENCGTHLHQRAFTEKEITDACFDHEMDEYED